MVTTANVISAWHLDESSGTIIDAHASNDGTYNGALYSQSGKIGTSIGFDGSNDEIIMTSSPLTLTSDFSINTWFLLDDTTGFQTIINQGTDPANSALLFLRTNGNKLEAIVRDNGSNIATVTGTTNLSTGVFHMATVTWDASTGKLELFLNNSSQGSTTNGAIGISTFNILNLGSLRRANIQDFYKGDIDETVLFDKILTTEINDLWNSGAGLVYPFSAATLRQIKIGGSFVAKPILTKVAGTFVDKPIKIKVGGTFQ